MRSVYWTPMIRCWRWRTLSKFGKRASLNRMKELRKLNLLQKGKPWRIWSLLKGLNWFKLASRCLRISIGTRWEHKHLDRELCRCSLAMTRLWRRNRGICLVRLQCLLSPSYLQRLVHIHLEMIEMATLQFTRKSLFLKPVKNIFSEIILPILILPFWKNLSRLKSSRLTSPVSKPPTTKVLGGKALNFKYFNKK